MPRTQKFDPLDFRNNRPAWALALQDKDTNAASKVDAAIKAIGVPVSAEQRQSMINQVLTTGDFDLAIPEDKPAAVLPVAKTAEEPSFLDQAKDFVTSSLTNIREAGSALEANRRASSASVEASRAAMRERGLGLNSTVEDITPEQSALTTGANLAGAFTGPVIPALAGVIKPFLGRGPRTEEEQADLAKTAQEKAEAAATASDIAKEADKKLGPDSKLGWVAHTIGSAAGQPRQILPTVGGLIGGNVGAGIGSIPLGADIYDQSYLEAEKLGATKEEADTYANIITGINMGIETASGGLEGFLAKGKIGAKGAAELAKKGLLKKIASRTARITGAAAVEGAENVAQEGLQDLTLQGMEATGSLDSPEARSKLKQYNAERTVGILDRYLDSFGQGALIGGLVSSPTAVISHAADLGRAHAETLKQASQGSLEAKFRGDQKRGTEIQTDTETNLDIKRELDRQDQERAKKDAFKQAEQERAAQEKAAAQQKADEEEAGFRTIALEDKFKGVTRVEKAGDNLVERIPVNPPAEITPAQVQEERQQAEATEADRLNRVELGGLTEQLRKRQEAHAKRASDANVKTEKAARTAEGKRRRVLMDQLIQENPEATPADLAPILRERLSQPATATPVAETKVAPTAAPVTPEAPYKPDNKLAPTEVDELANKLGLDMKAEHPTPEGEGDPWEGFAPKLSTAIKSLVKRNTQATTDVQNLVRQKKVVFAPNPKAIGREDTGAAAQYDIGDGKMYVYLDRVDPGDVTAQMVATLHEGTHAGQFNDRGGRSSIFSQMMSQSETNKASAKIRQAAASGNKIAQTAVAKAKAAGDNEALELVPYFVGEAVKARGGTLGQLRGVANDITTAARTFMKDHMGVKLDLSLGDLDSAAQKVGGEIAKTEVKPQRDRDESLDMIAGRNATGFRDAVSKGKNYKGHADQGERFEIPDNKAEILDPNEPEDQEVYNDLLKGATVPLSKVLNHDLLYTNYPQLKDVKVQVGKLESLASYQPAFNTITIGRQQLVDAVSTGSTEFLRKLVLHETQHAIQNIEGFVSGTSNKNFLPNTTVREYRDAEDKLANIAKNFDLGSAVKGLDFETKKAWESFLRWSRPETPRETAALFLTNDEFVQNTSERSAKRTADAYGKALMEYRGYAQEFNKATAKAYQIYLRNYGETEARNTEFRSRMSDSILEKLPPESTMKDAEGNIPVEKTMDTTPFTGSRNLDKIALSAKAPSLYRDTNADGAVDLVEGMTRGLNGLSSNRNSAFASATPELALGQSKNSGVMVELDPAGYDVQQSKSKPASDFLESQGESESILHNKPGINSGEFVKSITLNQGWKASSDPNYTERLLLRMRQGGWLRSTDAEGNVKYTNPKYATPKSLDLKAEKLPEQTKSVLGKVIRFAFDQKGGVGRDIAALMEYAESSPAAHLMLAEGSLGRYQDGLKKQAALLGTTPEALAKQIVADIDAVDKQSDDYKQNLEAFKGAVAKYGAAGEALLELRQQTDNMALDMLRSRAAENRPLTPAEKETFQTIKNNLGRYAHRQYAINVGGGRGKKFADAVWDQYEKVKSKGDDKASEAEKANYARVANAVKVLVDDVMIPDDKGLSEMNADTTRRMFETWTNETNPEAFTLDEMKAKLSEMRDQINGDSDTLQSTAEEIAKEIMGLGLTDKSSPITKYYRGGRLDKGILQERKSIPSEIRELMGEIKDPAMRLFTSVAKQTEFVARNRMLLEIKNAGMDEHVQPPGSPGRSEVKGMVKLEGDTYGPLQNHYVSEALHDRLSSVVQQLATFEQAAAMAAANPNAVRDRLVSLSLNGWGKVAGTTKALQIVGKPANFLFNLAGGPRTLLMHGNINPKHIAKAFSTATNLITYAINPSVNTAEARRVTAAGVTDSAFIGEIRGERHHELTKVLKEMEGKKPSQMYEGLRKAGLTWKETYAMMDVVYKIANFYQQADGVLPAYYEASGIGKSQEAIDREAADITNHTNLTYKRAAPIVRAAEKYGATNFGTFFYETFRTEINNLGQAFAEMKRAQNTENPKAAAIMWAQGSKRLLGQLTVWGLTAGLGSIASKAVFGDDEDKNKKLRALLPDYLRNQDFAIMGHDTEGNAVLFDWSRIDPAQPVSDIMRAALHQDTDLKTLASNVFDLYVAPRIGVKVATAVATQLDMTDKTPPKPLMQQWFPEEYARIAGTSRESQAWTGVAESFLPGITASWTKTNKRAEPDDATAILANALTYVGGRMYTLDPDKAYQRIGYDYSDAIKEAKQGLTDLYKNDPHPSQETVNKVVLDAITQEKEAFNKVKEVYDGLQELDLPPKKMKEVLKAQNRNIPVGVVSDLRKGVFKSHVVSKKSLETRRGLELASVKTREEKKEIKIKWKNIEDMLELAQHNNEEQQ